MKISTKAKYGVRACFILALSPEAAPVPLTELVKKTGLSEKYLEQLLGTLVRGKVLGSKRGAVGGYYLLKSPAETTVGSIMRAVKELELSDCGDKCTDAYCPNRALFIGLNSKINEVLNGITLKNMIDDHACAVKKA